MKLGKKAAICFVRFSRVPVADSYCQLPFLTALLAHDLISPLAFRSAFLPLHLRSIQHRPSLFASSQDQLRKRFILPVLLSLFIRNRGKEGQRKNMESKKRKGSQENGNNKAAISKLEKLFFLLWCAFPNLTFKGIILNG